MLLKECYDAFGGSYESVKERISKDEIIKKFVIKFLSEPSYGELCDALETEDYETAFRAAHSLKGVSDNLGFQKLGSSSSLLTECLRGKNEQQIDKQQCKELFESVSEDYNEVMEAVRTLAETE